MPDRVPVRPFRSRDWFAGRERPDMTAIYTERFMATGITPHELRSGKPIIGIAQSGSDLNPCNMIHVSLAKRVRDGIRDAGGVPLEFPVHPIFEEARRPTAALDRNLAYLGLVELLYGYPFDAVVLTTGCDKTTPSAIMAAATVDIPAIVLSGGPMLDGWHDGHPVGAGTIIWQSRRRLAAGEITEEEFFETALGSSPSLGHCNTMGTASTMNAVAEALGLSLTGCAAIPAVYGERGRMAYDTGRRIVELAYLDVKPSDILARAAFLNAMKLVSAIGGSSNAQPHLMAMARHAGAEITPDDWMAHGYDIPLLVNMQPAGKHLGERFHRAGGVPAVMWELHQAGQLDGDCAAVTGRSVAENLAGHEASDREVILFYDRTAEDPRRISGAERQSVRFCDHEDQRHLRRLPRPLPRATRPRGGVRGSGNRLRRLGGLPRQDQRSRSRDRRELHPGHARRRSDRMAGFGGGGQHATARRHP